MAAHGPARGGPALYLVVAVARTNGLGNGLSADVTDRDDHGKGIQSTVSPLGTSSGCIRRTDEPLVAALLDDDWILDHLDLSLYVLYDSQSFADPLSSTVLSDYYDA